ncbi:paraquat-inducible protein A [Salipiger sp. IMCC34102]|nr:paraquat-inducible protein A [Salipiger sp. IMCC34102]
MPLPPLEDLIACPHCDTLHIDAPVPPGSIARCKRCGVVLFAPRKQALTQLLSLSIAGVILLVAAISFPFIDIDAMGFENQTSVLNAVTAFSEGRGVPLAVAVALFIIVLPMVRLLALIYAIGPLVTGHRPRRGAHVAFAMTEQLRPWAMAEIFMVGVSVALVKIVGLATVTIGPAFWAFVVLVIITLFNDRVMSRLSIWKALEREGAV